VIFEGFVDETIAVGPVDLRVRHGGDPAGHPLLLIHGHPRTSATWHKVAPALVADGFRVICPDMRGYGRSTSPPPRPDHAQQSKRAVAADLVSVMQHLGHPRFSVAGHDRGGYVAMRLALDHPLAIARLSVLDGVPIAEAIARCDARFAERWFHWFFFAQPSTPERVINADPDAWYAGDAARMGQENYDEFREATRDPATVLAMLEDYRAGLGIDLQHDLQDQMAGRRIECPTQVLWSSEDDLEELYGDPLAVWAPWCIDLRGHSIKSGHHMAEDNPTALAGALSGFFSATS
jgi:haloacetate dehalogenase